MRRVFKGAIRISNQQEGVSGWCLSAGQVDAKRHNANEQRATSDAPFKSYGYDGWRRACLKHPEDAQAISAFNFDCCDALAAIILLRRSITPSAELAIVFPERFMYTTRRAASSAKTAGKAWSEESGLGACGTAGWHWQVDNEEPGLHTPTVRAHSSE